jgi:trk system potassium uptake protein TrkH
VNLKTVLWVVGIVLGVVGLAQIPSLGVALVLGEPWAPFALTLAIGLGLGWLFAGRAQREDLSLNHRSAFLAVTLSWFGACALGAVTLLTDPAPALSVLDAFFESTAGFTTTGATAISGLDRMPRSLLLWRSLSQWLGGMGMVLLGVAVFPLLGLGGMQLFKAEAPGPSKDKLTPRIAETAKILWVLYLGLTVLDAVLLYIGGMSLFDAVCHSMSTISTGGFSTHDTSLAYYDSGFIHLVTAAFMLLGGTSFLVLNLALTRGLVWSEHPELRAYLAIFTAAAFLIALDLGFRMPEKYDSAAMALEHGIFQAASILTTTGFTTRDFDLWPSLSHAVLLTLCFVGGMAGSTGGGIKVIRILVVARLAWAQFFRLAHPRGVGAIRIGTQILDEGIVLSVLGFFGLWFFVLFLGTALLSLFGSDVLTSFTAAAVTLGNIGPGFGGVGPSHTYHDLETGAKLTLCVLMILGRLEIYTALIVLTPSFWRRW